MFVVCLFAQKQTTITNYIDGNLSKEQFVKEMVQSFDKYKLSTKQIAKLTQLANKKAENYGIIAKMKSSNPDLYQRKMDSQRQHTIESLRFILKEEQYRTYMMDIRMEMNEHKIKGTKKK